MTHFRGSKITHRFAQASLAALLVASISCGSPSATQRKTAPILAAGSESDNATALAPLSALDAETEATWLAALSARDPATLDADELWAFSQCGCGDAWRQKYLAAISIGRGPLPQVLVPQIRREILADPTLVTLLSFAGGPFKSGVDWLLQHVVTDDTVAEKIRSGLVDRVTKAIGGAGGLDPVNVFRFDLFPKASKDSNVSKGPVTFAVRDQMARASLVFSDGAVWSGSTTGSLLLETARVMSEWRYVIGDPEAGTSKVSGGLLFDPSVGVNAALSAFDPGQNATAAGVFSGNYTVSFVNVNTPSSGAMADSLTAALNAEERWQRDVKPVTLDEQAMVMAAAARMFARLKPSRRSAAQGLFAPQNGLFPVNAHALPLALLPGVAALLKDGFIDVDLRFLRHLAVMPGSPDDAATDAATLTETARMLAALSLWYTELDGLSPIDTPSEAGASLSDAAPTLLRAMQLMVDVILRDHVRASPAAEDGLIFVEAVGDAPAAAGIAAEALQALVSANAVAFKSDLLSAKIAALSARFGMVELPALIAQGPQSKSLHDLAQALGALRALHASDLETSPEWLGGSVDALSRLVDGTREGAAK